MCRRDPIVRDQKQAPSPSGDEHIRGIPFARESLGFSAYTAFKLEPVTDPKLHPKPDGTIHPGDIRL